MILECYPEFIENCATLKQLQIYSVSTFSIEGLFLLNLHEKKGTRANFAKPQIPFQMSIVGKTCYYGGTDAMEQSSAVRNRVLRHFVEFTEL